MDAVDGLSPRRQRDIRCVEGLLVSTFPALPQVVDLLSPQVLTEHVYAFKISQFNGMAEP